MRTQVWTLGLLLATSLAGGCAPGQSAEPADGPDPLAQEAPALNARVIHVNNRNWQDLDVFAVRDDFRIRLGTVSAMAARYFRVPPALTNGAGDFEVLLAPPGEANGFLTPMMMLRAGETLDVEAQPTLSLSSYRIH